MNQRTFFDTPPHVVGSDTSREAAESVAQTSQALREQVYRYIRDCGERGATMDEAEAYLNRSHQSVSPRFRELCGGGKHNLPFRINRPGRKRKTRSGRRAEVYVVADAPAGA